MTSEQIIDIFGDALEEGRSTGKIVFTNTIQLALCSATRELGMAVGLKPYCKALEKAVNKAESALADIHGCQFVDKENCRKCPFVEECKETEEEDCITMWREWLFDER